VALGWAPRWPRFEEPKFGEILVIGYFDVASRFDQSKPNIKPIKKTYLSKQSQAHLFEPMVNPAYTGNVTTPCKSIVIFAKCVGTFAAPTPVVISIGATNASRPRGCMNERGNTQ
jgi:hypothetical protein